MKKNLAFISLMIIGFITNACPVCERNQPKVLRGIVHGSGPESKWDYVSVWLTGIIALVTLFYTIKWLIKPGEKNKDHIKYSVLN